MFHICTIFSQAGVTVIESCLKQWLIYVPPQALAINKNTFSRSALLPVNHGTVFAMSSPALLISSDLFLAVFYGRITRKRPELSERFKCHTVGFERVCWGHRAIGSGAYLLPSYFCEETGKITGLSKNNTAEKPTTGLIKSFTSLLMLFIAHGLGKRTVKTRH